MNNDIFYQIFQTSLPAVILSILENLFFIYYGRKDAANQIDGVIDNMNDEINDQIKNLNDYEKMLFFKFIHNINKNSSKITTDSKKKSTHNKNVIRFSWKISLTLFFICLSSLIYLITK